MTRRRGPRQLWSEEDIAWLVALWPDVKSALVAEALGRRLTQCYGMAGKLGLKKSAEYLTGPDACRLRREDSPGIAYRFKPGIVPWNTGMKGWTAGGRSAETRFKKCQKPANWLPIGSHRLMDGYLQRKMTDTGYPPRDWVGVHILLWQEHHGPVPAGHKLRFRNGDKTDIRIENIELITDAENMRRNSYHTNYPPELCRVIQLRGALVRKINKRSKKHEQDHR
jgi:hypothetical protein